MRMIPAALQPLRDEPGGAAWLEALPAVADACARRWSLRLGAPFEDASVSYVVPATSPGVPSLVLEIQFPHPECLHEADALRCWAGDLHRGNVLRATREPWLVIDPKPLLAEPAYAVANRLPLFGLDDIGHDVSAVARRIDRLCTALDLDPAASCSRAPGCIPSCRPVPVRASCTLGWVTM